MTKTWVVGDLHLGHKNILTFKDNQDNFIRPFKTIEEHDEKLISYYNDLVDDRDRVYFLGDLVINRRCLPLLKRFKGRKKLIKGNHDIFKLQDYLPYFDDIAAYRTYPSTGIILSHIPVHRGQLEYRFKCNVHGHLHSNIVRYLGAPDPKYINVCPEHTNWKPVDLNDLEERVKLGGW